MNAVRNDVPPPTPAVTLSNGVIIPQIGFGTYKVAGDEATRSVLTALEAGYRHIDTAQMYRNEAEIGQAIARSGLDRGEVFLTSKLNNPYHAYDDARAAFQGSLDALGTDYVDLFLIHWPLPAVGLFPEAWAALEEEYRAGRARAIGVSNFQTHHLDALAATATVTPMVNQVELHPYLTQHDLVGYNAARGIVTEAWSPLGRGAVLDDPVLARIAADHHCSPAQVVIRWHLDRGRIAIPKSVTPDRIHQNLASVSVTLSDAELQAIDALNCDQRFGTHPDVENRINR